MVDENEKSFSQMLSGEVDDLKNDASKKSVELDKTHQSVKAKIVTLGEENNQAQPLESEENKTSKNAQTNLTESDSKSSEKLIAKNNKADKAKNGNTDKAKDDEAGEVRNDESDALQSLDETFESKKTEKKYANNVGSKEFLENLLKLLSIEATVTIEEEDDHSRAVVTTEKAGIIIGHKGESLSAIQYIANIAEQRHNKNAKRLIVDVNDYRDRHDDSLKDLADRMARQVVKYKKSVKLRPMNAYDRRIVHTYLQTFNGVTTHSVGKEPNRCLIIDVERDGDF